MSARTRPLGQGLVPSTDYCIGQKQGHWNTAILQRMSSCRLQPRCLDVDCASWHMRDSDHGHAQTSDYFNTSAVSKHAWRTSQEQAANNRTSLATNSCVFSVPYMHGIRSLQRCKAHNTCSSGMVLKPSSNMTSLHDEGPSNQVECY